MGDRGPYEQLTGVAHFAVDPKSPANANIVDLGLAPRNDKGRVEFQFGCGNTRAGRGSRANGAVFYEVNNRGNKTAPNMFNGGADDFLMRQGYVVVWSGWIAEVLPTGGRLKFQRRLPCKTANRCGGRCAASSSSMHRRRRLPSHISPVSAAIGRFLPANPKHGSPCG